MSGANGGDGDDGITVGTGVAGGVGGNGQTVYVGLQNFDVVPPGGTARGGNGAEALNDGIGGQGGRGGAGGRAGTRGLGGVGGAGGAGGIREASGSRGADGDDGDVAPRGGERDAGTRWRWWGRLERAIALIVLTSSACGQVDHVIVGASGISIAG